MAKTIVQEMTVNLKGLEQEIYRWACKMACEKMAELLEWYDLVLAINRDSRRYRHKGMRKTTLKTIMGEVPFNRAIYKDKQHGEGKKYIHLLDEAVGFDTIGLISSNLAEKVAEEVCTTSFKNAARHISELTGQSISHGGAWNLIQKLGKRAEELEDNDVKLHQAGEAAGTREVKVLFEEADGVMLKMQGKDRKKGKRQEMKVGIFYEGWQKENAKRYRLYNKKVVCGFEGIASFAKRMEAKVASIYNTDEIAWRIFNSDGAAGLKRVVDGDAVCQLDPFHVKQAIIRATCEKAIQRNLSDLYSKGEIEKFLETIEAYSNSMENENAETKLRGLYDYLNENKMDLLPYLKRGLKIPEAPKGLEYRGMGACEHNVYLAIAKRMKHMGASWSKPGANNLGKILTLKMTGELGTVLEEVTKVSLPEEMTKKIVTVLSSSTAPVADGKGYEGRVSSRPFVNCFRTNGRDAIDGMFDLKPFSEMVYR